MDFRNILLNKDLSNAEKVILIYLNNVDSNDTMIDMAWHLGVSDRAVRGTLKKLEEKELIRVIKKGHNTIHGQRYEIITNNLTQ